MRGRGQGVEVRGSGSGVRGHGAVLQVVPTQNGSRKTMKQEEEPGTPPPPLTS